MRWELTFEQKTLGESFKGWLSSAAPSSQIRDWWEGGNPAEFEEKLNRDGWSTVGVAESAGGQGGGLLELALAAEQLGQIAAPSSRWLGESMALAALSGHDDAIGRILGGGVSMVLALAGSQVPSAQGFAVLSDGRLSGRIPMVVGADRADELLVPARSGDTIQLFRVRTGDGGVAIRPRKLLDRSRRCADVQLDRVHGELITPLERDGIGKLAATAAVLVAADALGTMGRLLDETIGYVAQRFQFGVPIGSFQAVQHEAVSMLVELEAARSIVYFAAATIAEDDRDSGWHASVAKAQVTANAPRVADSALMLHGAIGYTWEHDLHFIYKRAALDRELFGNPNSWNDRIAEMLYPAGDAIAG